MSVIFGFVMPNPAHPDCPKTLALIVQYFYEADPEFEKALDKIIFKKGPTSKKKKFTLKCLLKNKQKIRTESADQISKTRREVSQPPSCFYFEQKNALRFTRCIYNLFIINYLLLTYPLFLQTCLYKCCKNFARTEWSREEFWMILHSDKEWMLTCRKLRYLAESSVF